MRCSILIFFAPPQGGVSVENGALSQACSGLVKSLTFYEGPPAEKASLVYDEANNSNGEFVATWHFDQNSPRGYWLTCSYAGTEKMFSGRLSSALT